jgi:hypothetical protein
MYTNEGFARWLQYTCNKEVIPEWDFFNAGMRYNIQHGCDP